MEHTIDGVVLFLLGTLCPFSSPRESSHQAPSHERRLLVHVRLWAGGFLFTFSFSQTREKSEMACEAVRFFAHSATCGSRKPVSLPGSDSVSEMDVSVSGAITLGVFSFFPAAHESPPLMGVWFSVTTGDSKSFGALS